MLNLELFLASFHDELMDELMAVGVVKQPKAEEITWRAEQRGIPLGAVAT